jgi:hypothetical protein
MQFGLEKKGIHIDFGDAFNASKSARTVDCFDEKFVR